MSIAKLSVVRAYGTGSFVTVRKYNPGGPEEPALVYGHEILGVAMTDSGIAQPLQVMRRGYLRGCPQQNGETWNGGDLLWCADASYPDGGGSVTNVRPPAPAPQIYVGWVFATDAGNADVAVDVRIIPSLGELSGVSQETPEDLDVFIYKAATQVWEPRQLVVADLVDGLTWHYAMRGF